MAELKSLLLARFNAEESNGAKLSARIQQELGNEMQEEKPEIIAIKKKFADLTCDILARRLKRNRRATPLFSSRDFVRFAPLIINELAKIEGDELEVEERKIIERVARTMFENIFEMLLHATVPPHKNPYKEYWRWVTTVLDLATERSILPTELLALENATDEIMRRMFTEKQFVTLSNKTTSKLMDADVLKKVILQPILDMDAKGDKEKRREMEQEFEAEFMPELRGTLDKLKVVIKSLLDEEVGRIYTAA